MPSMKNYVLIEMLASFVMDNSCKIDFWFLVMLARIPWNFLEHSNGSHVNEVILPK